MTTEFTIAAEVEGTKVTITRNTDELSEAPGRFGLHLGSTQFHSTMKVYFDDINSLIAMRNLLDVAITTARIR